jgi:Cytochrome P450
LKRWQRLFQPQQLSSYTLYPVIYRLYLSPVSSIPGPKLAAVTYFYEIYYDIVKNGTMFKRLQILHEQYGPIIRIYPHEVHVNDPDFFDTIYSSERRDKSEYHTRTTPNRLSAFGTTDHDLHRRRPAALNPFFSKGQIRKFSPWIQDRSDILCRRLEDEYKGTDKV